MIDEFNLVEELWRDEQEARQFLARLKALTEDEPRLKFIFCYQENLYRRVLSPGARLISAPLVRSCRGLRLEFLDAAAAENLIRQPMGDFLAFDAALVSELLRLTAGHPYYLQNLLQALVEYGGRRPERRLTLADLEAVLPGLLANGLQLFHYFLQYHSGDRGLPLPSVLSALAHLNVERAQPAAPAELQTLLEQQRVRIPLESLVDALEYLRDAGVVERRLESNRARYTLRLPMLARWLVQERPLSLIQPYTWRERRAK
jgi:DNA-binding transcriptional ArsR family regulator